MDVYRSLQEELNKEAEAILRVARQLDPEQVDKAFQLLLDCQGKVVVTGMGKAGIVARKISATLASTGTTSIFLHAAEGIHGDLGMLQRHDLLLAVSHSGNTQELLSIIPYVKFVGIPIIAITGNVDSPLAQNADAILDCSIPADFEALGMVPTASTTVELAVGDALAILLLKKKNFSLVDFARFHPGGSIGKQLLLKVKDLMHTGEELPFVRQDTSMSEAILVMTSKKLGCTAVVDEDSVLIGIITDGDLRRQIQLKQDRLLAHPAKDCMTVNPKSCHPEDLAASALRQMEKHKITMLPVLNDSRQVVGILHMHDLVLAGII